MFGRRAAGPPGQRRVEPDFAAIHEQLQTHKYVTLQLLWEEYIEAHPEGYRYSRFCELYQRWRRKLDVVLRQQHRAGEKLFVDYAGATVPVENPQTGEVRQAQVFVAVLGASSYTYAEATWSQDLANWTGSHMRAFEFFGGVCRRSLSPTTFAHNEPLRIHSDVQLPPIPALAKHRSKRAEAALRDAAACSFPSTVVLPLFRRVRYCTVKLAGARVSNALRRARHIFSQASAARAFSEGDNASMRRRNRAGSSSSSA